MRFATAITASLTGSGVSLLSFFQHVNVMLGFVAGIIGIVAGYYALRLKKAEWDEKQRKG